MRRFSNLREVGGRGQAFPTEGARAPAARRATHGVTYAVLLAAFGACTPRSPSPAGQITFLLDTPPVTLNPRATFDASGQRLNALIFRALTRIDSQLVPQPDLATAWRVGEGGRVWTFDIRPGLVDHAGAPITPEKIRACLENYRTGKPTSNLRGAFPTWIATRASSSAGNATRDDAGTVTLLLKTPDPYLARNLSALRYFDFEGSPSPCAEPPSDRALIGSGNFRPEPWRAAPEDEFRLVPAGAAAGDPAFHPLRFVFVQDDNTKALKLLSGEVDAIQNGISAAKSRWIQREYADRFDLLEAEGVVVGYLTFNLRDPVLRKREVRQAIARAIDKDDIIRHKFMAFATPASSFLSPLLPESHSAPLAYDPALAERLLDAAGYPRGRDGVRLRLHYKTTPIRDGFENALMIQQMLGRVGIRLTVDVVEPAVFFASIKRGNFQLYSSRWLGVADASILYTTLHSGQPNNRAKYENAQVDRLLEDAISKVNLAERRPLVARVQAKMMEDLPYFPLWYWKNVLIVRRGLGGLGPADLSLSGGLEPLTRLGFSR